MKRVALLALLIAATVSAQPSPRRATNVAALLAHPAFYHLRPIVLVDTVTLQNNGQMRVGSDSGSLHLLYKGSPPDGPAEIRGEFWDLGRLNADDPRLAGIDVRSAFGVDPDGAWPRPGQVLALVATQMSPASQPPAPSIRNIVLFPSRYVDQKVTVIGQFAGRNLLGDLADAPAQSRYDFVLRSADAAIWITNMRPRGKDFELALDARIDTGRWLELSGTLQQGRGLQWLDAEAGSLKLTQPPKETTEDQPIRVPAAPPPEVVFSTPTEGESDVVLSTNVRIQFSRDINPSTFRNRVIVKYSDAETRERGEPESPKAEFTTQYLPGTRVLEIRFTAPLERFRTIQVQLMEGIMGTDGQGLRLWTLTFATGGS